MADLSKVQFDNKEGLQLSGYLQLPANGQAKYFAVLAHCFSCSKNARAIREISRALNQVGIGILRFDMTGLGESEGDFGRSGFQSHVHDIEYAIKYLSDQYEAPQLLIGHSLGGTATILAAAKCPSVKAVVTIGSPSDPGHVTHLFDESLEEIAQRGSATVKIGGRPFAIHQDFVDSLQSNAVLETLREHHIAYLFIHSPQDQIVAIEHARKLYEAALHPKSFMSLDGADHMVTKKADAHYVAQVVAQWANRYIEVPVEENPLTAEHQVAVRLDDEAYTTEVMVRQHQLVADEPPEVGGKDLGPSPYELVTAGLGACTVMTLKMYARRKKWPLESVEVQLKHYKSHAEDVQKPEEKEAKIDHFLREITLIGPLDDEQKARLMEIADRCPVHRTLHSDVKVITELKS